MGSIRRHFHAANDTQIQMSTSGVAPSGLMGMEARDKAQSGKRGYKSKATWAGQVGTMKAPGQLLQREVMAGCMESTCLLCKGVSYSSALANCIFVKCGPVLGGFRHFSRYLCNIYLRVDIFQIFKCWN